MSGTVVLDASRELACRQKLTSEKSCFLLTCSIARHTSLFAANIGLVEVRIWRDNADSLADVSGFSFCLDNLKLPQAIGCSSLTESNECDLPQHRGLAT